MTSKTSLTDEVPVRMYEVRKSKSEIVIMAENNSFRPYTVKVDFKGKNIRSGASKNFYFVIGPKEKSFEVTNLQILSKSYSYHYDFKCFSGDRKYAKHDQKYIYNLPFEENYITTVTQGYRGKFSHKKINALDFKAPLKTSIVAVRSGVVVEYKENSNNGCGQPKCNKMANYLRILHDDGTESLYSHLAYNGVLVEEGEHVATGQKIALSGNTGWSTNPHLHFEVLQPTLKGEESVKTLFFIDGKPTVLKQGMKIRC